MLRRSYWYDIGMRFLFLILLAWGNLAASAHAAEKPLLFESSVRKILKAHCWQCHGEEKELKGDLDTRLVRFLLKGGESGPAIVPGNHKKSRLYQRVASGEMPPGKKRLSAKDVKTLAEWIDQGAKTARPEPKKLSGEQFTVEELKHWSFQPIKRPRLPAVKSVGLTLTPIDNFLLSKLESKGLSYGPQASRDVLLRRLSFDLTGLPPTPREVAEFRNDRSVDAYERVVERLLASPSYGEKWARHWLDVGGYADSDGYNPRDEVRKWAYHYRDYVIRSLNSDQPFRDFLIEQLAGDELVQGLVKGRIHPDDARRLIATGFLRMGPDGTSTNNNPVARNAVISETIKVLSTALLGLSVGCAQCHSHRYDPITQVDYYRIRALLEPAYNVKNWRTPGGRQVTVLTPAQFDKRQQVHKQLRQLTKEKDKAIDQLVIDTYKRLLSQKVPSKLQKEVGRIRATPKKKRTTRQRELATKYEFVDVTRTNIARFANAELRKLAKLWSAKEQAAKKRLPPQNMVMPLTEIVGQVPKTFLFSRGDFRQPRQSVLPGEISVLTSAPAKIPSNDPNVKTSGRRLAYARHLTNGKHPLLARVLINRVWHHHFGQGIVRTLSDFGMIGERPSHPLLLDWLASEFMSNGWSLKNIHRLIVTSRAYRQTSKRRRELNRVDPENRLLGRMSVRRLDAEAVRDSLLFLGGRFSYKMYGKPVPVSPDPAGQIIIAVDTRDSAKRPTSKFVYLGEEEFRRSIYVQVRRSMPLAVLEPFDLPGLSPNCERRPSSTTPPQALLMLNNSVVIRESQGLAAELQKRKPKQMKEQIELAWLRVFGRQVTSMQIKKSIAFLNREQASLRRLPKPPKHLTHEALARFCQALICSNGFLYVE